MPPMTGSYLTGLDPPLLPALLADILFLLLFRFVQIFVQAIKAFLPEPPVVFHPIGNVFERAGFELAGPPLSFTAAHDQPRSLQNLQVFGDGGKAYLKWFGQFCDGRFA